MHPDHLLQLHHQRTAETLRQSADLRHLPVRGHPPSRSRRAVARVLARAMARLVDEPVTVTPRHS